MNYIEKLAKRIREETPADALPSGDVEALFLLYALLAEVKGESIELEDVHDAWSTWMTLRSMPHESVVPFRELSATTQDEDRPFKEAILRALASF